MKICCVAFNIHIVDMANGHPSRAWLDDFDLCHSRFSLSRKFNKSSALHIIFGLYDISGRISNISDRLSIPLKKKDLIISWYYNITSLYFRQLTGK